MRDIEIAKKNKFTYHTLIELKFDIRYGVIFMAKLRLRVLEINNNSNKTVAEIHEEYMSYCKSIGQLHEGDTIVFKEISRFTR